MSNNDQKRCVYRAWGKLECTSGDIWATPTTTTSTIEKFENSVEEIPPPPVDQVEEHFEEQFEPYNEDVVEHFADNMVCHSCNN